MDLAATLRAQLLSIAADVKGSLLYLEAGAAEALQVSVGATFLRSKLLLLACTSFHCLFVIRFARDRLVTVLYYIHQFLPCIWRQALVPGPVHTYVNQAFLPAPSKKAACKMPPLGSPSIPAN